MSIGYGVAAGILWLLVSAALGTVYPLSTTITFMSMAIPVAFIAMLLGAIIDCTFQTIGGYFSLSPSTSILIGWISVSLGMALMALLNAPPPPTIESVAQAVFDTGSKSLSNSFLSSDIFYKIGNFTLNLLGFR
ncbi:hypothetical protein IPA_05275 [Ignicoccus pacificus DSM 13166]|uniref:Uncharacterized protein n=1 Tax=Ignicoccus pacificus DSM 13166 TaxID=940294 RepID=A0A977KB86_9CREN|nr:hypothetical protein IPA_05275 [Ignicoccus pacificus DSM 13166]